MAPANPSRISLRLGVTAVRDALRFYGRSTIAEVVSYGTLYSAIWAALLAVTFALVMLDPANLSPPAALLLFLCKWIWLPALLAAPALLARRLHDQGLSAWWLLVPLLAFLIGNFGTPAYLAAYPNPHVHLTSTGFRMTGWHWTPTLLLLMMANLAAPASLLVAAFRRPTLGPNRYGPDPRIDAGPVPPRRPDGLVAGFPGSPHSYIPDPASADASLHADRTLAPDALI